MTVGKLIAALQQEDLNARVVILRAHHRHRTLRELEEGSESQGCDCKHFTPYEVVGKDSTSRRSPAVVILALTHG